MKLLIIHYHLRPGGVRRIIELATPHLVRHFEGAIGSIVLATGEPPDPKWENLFRRQLAETPVEFFIEPAFNYLSEQALAAAQVQGRVRAALKTLFAGMQRKNALIWAHNLGIARNVLLTREVTRTCAIRKLSLVLHHHDWWFDNRWLRWREMRRFGFRTLTSVARAIFPAARSVHHLAINRSDAIHLRHGFPESAGWLPNITECTMPPSVARVRWTGDWLRRKLNDRAAPVWILPCRGLRRKNIAEALLLTRWLRPEAWLVTTGGASSDDEKPFFNQLVAAARQHGWPLRPGILQGDETNKPSVAELLAASEAVLLTSIQEGFGLPYLEAAAARRPLIARSIPNVAPDLEQLGFRFPQYYKEILIDASLFDWRAERKRQSILFQTWRQGLPRPVQGFVGKPALLAAASKPCPLPFSRLTLRAQLEILAQGTGLSWRLCAPLNPFLAKWQQRAQAGRLQVTTWPGQADKWLGGPAYARRFVEISSRFPNRRPLPGAGLAVQAEFLRSKLGAQHLFPLLWATRT
jgi:glycosyltransferase involved in cell wall biosynthesis